MPLKTVSEAEKKQGVGIGGAAFSGVGTPFNTGLASLVGASLVINPTVLTAFPPTYTLAANRLAQGTVLRVRVGGAITVVTPTPLGIRMRIGGNAFMGATTAANLAAGVNTWSAWGQMTVGVAGLYRSLGALVAGPNGSTGVVATQLVADSSATVTMSIANVIDIQVVMSVSDAGNQIVMDGMTIELMQPETLLSS